MRTAPAPTASTTTHHKARHCLMCRSSDLALVLPLARSAVGDGCRARSVSQGFDDPDEGSREQEEERQGDDLWKGLVEEVDRRQKQRCAGCRQQRGDDPSLPPSKPGGQRDSRKELNVRAGDPEPGLGDVPRQDGQSNHRDRDDVAGGNLRRGRILTHGPHEFSIR